MRNNFEHVKLARAHVVRHNTVSAVRLLNSILFQQTFRTVVRRYRVETKRRRRCPRSRAIRTAKRIRERLDSVEDTGKKKKKTYIIGRFRLVYIIPAAVTRIRPGIISCRRLIDAHCERPGRTGDRPEQCTEIIM